MRQKKKFCDKRVRTSIIIDDAESPIWCKKERKEQK